MIFKLLLGLIPVSLILAYVVHAPPLWIFVVSVLAIIPLAEWIRQSTEQLAERLGSAVGGLLNVTFGNMAELILALFVLRSGHPGVVKAQITGSIIGNSLLGLGLAAVVGGFVREKQSFNQANAGRLSSLLILAVIALMVPALFDYTERGLSGSANASLLDERLSFGVAIVLIFVYGANLVYSLVTHRGVFTAIDESGQSSGTGKPVKAKSVTHDAWPLWKVLGILVAATAVTAVEAELVSDALEETSTSLGVTTFFLGITVLAVVGNAAEYVSAVYFAKKDRMDLVMGITVGSTIQIALLVAPVLVIVSYFMGHPMNLVFSNPLELIAIAGAAFAVNSIAQDGETTWFEGVLLLAVYVLLGMAFYFVTPS
ncbi:MAG TPA: calcium/proton exchanger [Gemmatimonadaceae bacterium]